VMDGVLYFGGTTSGDITQTPQLWRTDGTDSGTYQVANNFLGNDIDTFALQSMAVLNGSLVFQGSSSTDFELWKADGTASGTVLVKDIMVAAPFLVFGSAPALMTLFNGQVYFSADDWYHGREIWRTDGTTAGTVLVKNINDIKFSDNSAYDF